MGKIDTIAKKYFSNPDRFADAFNFFLYGGEPVIRTDELRPLDTSAIAMPYTDGTRKNIQKYRDIFKLYTAMQDGQATYIMLGIEAQSRTHYAMPVRNMLYDAISYADQVSSIADTNRKHDGKLTTDAEFLSGMTMDDRLTPVITLVISLSPETWNGALSLHEMLNVKNPELLKFLPDYRINLLTPGNIPESAFDRFQTELGVVMQFIKHQKEDDIKWMTNRSQFSRVNRDTADLIRILTGEKFVLPKGKETINMWAAWEKARSDGIKEGEEAALLKSIRNLMETLGFAPEKAMEALKVPENERPALLAKL